VKTISQAGFGAGSPAGTRSEVEICFKPRFSTQVDFGRTISSQKQKLAMIRKLNATAHVLLVIQEKARLYLRNATRHNKSDAAEMAVKLKCDKVASLPFTHQLSCQLQAKVYW